MQLASFPIVHNAGDFTVKAGWLLPNRQLNDYELVYFPKGGETEYHQDNETIMLRDPCFLIIRPDQRHSLRFDPKAPVRHLFVHFHLDGLLAGKDQLDLLLPNGPSVVPSRSALDAMVGVLFKKLLHMLHTKPAQWEFRSRLLLCQILYDLNEYAGKSDTFGPAGTSIPAPVLFVLDRMERQLHEELSISRLAQSVGWSHEHLTRSFIRYLGHSPREILLHKRIERASQLLVSEMRSVKEIAYSVGFKDEHYFSRAFAKVKGLSAIQYRSRFSSPIYQHLVPVDATESLYPQNVNFISDQG
jgi:AraC-like DNA-binding protein